MDSVTDLLAAADRCVKCALCLPHCPTYQLHADENASPRGRIALMEAVLREQLPLDATVQQHLDGCVMCQRCATVCPSQVPYKRLLDGVRHRWPTRQHWSRWLIQKPKWLRRLVNIAQQLPRWPNLPTPIRLAQALGTSTQPPQPGVYAPIEQQSRGRIGLHLGCVTQATQAPALHAARYVLQRLGYTVVIPPQQVCCGALAAHQGATEQATTLATQHAALFADQTDRVVSIASGCVAGSHADLQEITSFLAQDPHISTLPWRPLPYSIALHQPCTLCNGLHADQTVLALLRQIPKLRIDLLPHSCCGAGGDHLIRQRAQAEALRQPFLTQLQTSTVRYLLTTNTGCALHLAEGMRHHGLPQPVLHPVELLAQNLKSP